MDKTVPTELIRTFLIETLPQPLTRASSHLQIFDNYILGTRLRLRSVRDPATRVWSRSLQQRYPAHAGGSRIIWKTAELHLDEAEYSRFEIFEGDEIRKNRYFHEYDGLSFALDVYIGPLWGLNTAKISFRNWEEAEQFVPPPFAIFEVTAHEFFDGVNLVGKTIADVQNEMASIGTETLVISEAADE